MEAARARVYVYVCVTNEAVCSGKNTYHDIYMFNSSYKWFGYSSDIAGQIWPCHPFTGHPQLPPAVFTPSPSSSPLCVCALKQEYVSFTIQANSASLPPNTPVFIHLNYIQIKTNRADFRPRTHTYTHTHTLFSYSG